MEYDVDLAPQTDDSPLNDERRIFHEGVELFNRGHWFDAHEAWEDIWHIAAGEKKRFYQGLIQCAVTIEHIRRGNPRGVRSVYHTAIPKFTGLADIYMGIDLPHLLAGLERVVRPILDLPAEYFDPARPRGQTLPFEPKAAPQIKLLYDPFDDDHNTPTHQEIA